MISVVIPVLNEEESAPLLAQKLFDVLNKQNTDFEIIFVDDGSTDQTLNRLLNLKDKKIRLVELSRRYGQTAAISAGIDSAQGEIVIIMDGDLQHDPEDIPRFLEKIYEGFDIVSGWRKVRTDNFLIRKLPSYFANKAMRLVSGVEVQDFGSTYKAYRSDILQKIELFGELHRFIPVLASKVGAKICEIPISVHPRKLGKSKYNLNRTFGVFEDIIFLQFFVNYLTKPLRAFGKMFFYFFGMGFFISVTMMILWLFGVISTVRDHSAMLLFSVLLMILGIQFLVAGIIAELLTRIYHHTSGTKIYSIRKVHS